MLLEQSEQFRQAAVGYLRYSQPVLKLFNSGKQEKQDVIEVRRFAGPEGYMDELNHLRIAHLTDLHFGRITPLRIQELAVELTNQQKPDLVVITGDFVCHSQLYLDELSSTLSKLNAPVVGVLGNHDYWSGANEVRWALKRAGIEVLANQHTVLSLNHQKVQVVGLDDAYTGHADREGAVKGLSKQLPTIALSHIAEEADGLWNRGIKLVFSGHTHAGQVTWAKLHELAIGKLAGHKYVHGMYGNRRREEKAPHGVVYVGAGIGASVVPLRLGERGKRELALFELGLPLGSIAEHHSEQTPLQGRAPSPEKTAKRKANVERKRARREAKASKQMPKGLPIMVLNGAGKLAEL
jgi:uncharacterized protein